MKTSKQNLKFQVLGLRLQTANPAKNSTGTLNLAQRLQKIGQSLLNFLVSDRDLKVWHTYDRQGHILWHAHNPMNGETVAFHAKEEMLAWIEQHYYSSGDYAQKQYQNQLMFQR